MKLIDRLSLKIYALIVGVLSIMIALIVTGVIPAEYLTDPIVYLTDGAMKIRITLIVCAVLLILVLKSLCFASKPNSEGKEGIVLENTNGKLVISKESLENMIASLSKEIPGTESTTSKTLVDKDKNLKVYVTTVVNRDVMIKDVSTELQNKIKEAMKRTADLEVKEVNVRIKNITSKKMKGVQATKKNNVPDEDNNVNENENETKEEENSEENETREE